MIFQSWNNSWVRAGARNLQSQFNSVCQFKLFCPCQIHDGDENYTHPHLSDWSSGDGCVMNPCLNKTGFFNGLVKGLGQNQPQSCQSFFLFTKKVLSTTLGLVLLFWKMATLKHGSVRLGRTLTFNVLFSWWARLLSQLGIPYNCYSEAFYLQHWRLVHSLIIH